VRAGLPCTPNQSRHPPGEVSWASLSGWSGSAAAEGGLLKWNSWMGPLFIHQACKKASFPSPAGFITSPGHMPRRSQPVLASWARSAWALLQLRRSVRWIEAPGIGPWRWRQRPQPFRGGLAPGGSNRRLRQGEGKRYASPFHPCRTRACTGVGPRPFSPDLGAWRCPPVHPSGGELARCRAQVGSAPRLRGSCSNALRGSGDHKQFKQRAVGRPATCVR